jgi:hypothetical protein
VDGRWLAAFLVAGLTATVLALWGFSSAADRTAVLVVAREVPAGQPIPADALAVTGAAADHGVTMVAADAHDAVVGRPAARRLLPGTLLTPADLDDGPAVAAGERTVGARLPAGSYPHVMEPGDPVRALPVSVTGATSVAATVFAVSPAGNDASVVLVVSEADAEQVARWASEGDLALVGVGG